MKNLFWKTLVTGLFLLAIPLRQQAQQPSFPEKVLTIDFDVTGISLFDERVFFMYHLVNDARFNVVNSESNGVFIVSVDPAYEGLDLKAAFAEFQEQNALEFSEMDKEQASEVARAYKSALPQEIILSLMMDFYAQSRMNNRCSTAEPFCTDNGMYMFPAGVNAGSGESGPSYDCLSTTPNPAWYYMQMGNPGNMTIHMYSTPSVDIDFCCWGPFDDPVAPCPNGLTLPKVVSCSYSPSATENCQIPSSAQTGEFYILVITNFSNQTCNINFSKTGGSGTTDCSIMPPLVENDGPFCVGDDIHLSANGQSGAAYSWTGPNGFTSNQQNPVINSCSLASAGVYTCTITLGSQSNNASTSVAVYAQPTADFTASLACFGDPTQFTNTSTTYPAGEEITSYLWDFGDGESSPLQNPVHTFSTPGDYQVSLTVGTGHQSCTSEKTLTVKVAEQPVADAGTDQTIEYGQTAELNGAGGGEGFVYRWEPADKVVNPNAQNTQTVELSGQQTFTLTVTNPVGGCTDESQVTIHIEGSDLTMAAAASPSVICEGLSTQLNAHAGGGNYSNITYSWTPTTDLDNPSIANPVATPTTTTTYTCTVNDGFSQLSNQVTVTVNHHSNDTIAVINQCDSYDWQFGWNNEILTFTEGGRYTERIDTSHGCDSIVTLELQLDYSPTFSGVIGDTWVIGGSEFQYTIQQYWIETDPRSTHKTEWQLTQNNEPFKKWDMLQHGDSCMLYIYTYELEPVMLVATTSSTGDCECGTYTHSKPIICSAYGTEETLLRGHVDIYPNPNNGDMTLAFENIPGEVTLKVYDIAGMLLDTYTVFNGKHQQTHPYHVKHLSPGVYLFSFSHSAGVTTKKVILQ